VQGHADEKAAVTRNRCAGMHRFIGTLFSKTWIFNGGPCATFSGALECLDAASCSARRVAVLGAVASVATSATTTWMTSANMLLRDGSPVVLHGLGTTCTEFLLRGVNGLQHGVSGALHLMRVGRVRAGMRLRGEVGCCNVAR
jgi:hypothetical protein